MSKLSSFLGLREKFICSICRDSFQSRSSFSNHCKEVHHVLLLPRPTQRKGTGDTDTDAVDVDSIDEHDTQENVSPYNPLDSQAQSNQTFSPLPKATSIGKNMRSKTKKGPPKKQTKGKTAILKKLIDKTSITTDNGNSLCQQVGDKRPSRGRDALVLSIPISKLIRGDRTSTSADGVTESDKTSTSSSSGQRQSTEDPPKAKKNELKLPTGKKAKVSKKSPSKKTPSPEKQQVFCPVPGCDKSFTKRNPHRFKNHLEIHEGLKPFVCPYCSFGYETDIKLVEHVTLQHTKDPSFECIDCGHKYSTERFLLAHNKKFHQ